MSEDLAKVMQKLPALILKIDIHDNIVATNNTQIEPSDKVKDYWKTHIHPDDYQFVTNSYKVFKDEKTPFEMEYRLKDSKGNYKCILDKYNPLFDKEKNFQGYVSVGIDITNRKKHEEALEALSYRDTLTGIFNRNFFEETLEVLEEQIERKLITKPYTVFVIDINDLKAINDRLGHDKGDILLKCTAEILHNSVRKTDYVFRAGGDEFHIIAYACNETSARKIIGRIHSNTDKYNSKSKKDVYISLSIGWVTATNFKDAPKRLVRQADTYMYAFKNKNKERYHKEVEEFIKNRS